ncbi:hypothetical protein KC356_g129 [Hortaea werneckii]|nr:hypothetical protein KC356_g129 [Hortaea werneckii]
MYNFTLPRLRFIPALATSDSKLELTVTSSPTTLTGVLDHTPLLNPERSTSRLPIEQPDRLQNNTGIPSPGTHPHLRLRTISPTPMPTPHNLGRRLPRHSRLATSIRQHLLPIVPPRTPHRDLPRQRRRAIGRMLPDPPVQQVQIIPDLAILVIPTMFVLGNIREIRPPGTPLGRNAGIELVHPAVKEIIIPLPDVDEDAVAEVDAEVLVCGPVCGDVVGQIHMFPGLYGGGENGARDFVPRFERVVVVPLHAAEDGLPDVPLQEGARGGAEGQFPVVLLRGTGEDDFGVVAVGADRVDGGAVGPVVGVRGRVEGDVLVPVEVERVRVGGETGAEEVWAEDQVRRAFPAAGRAAFLDTGVGLGDGVEGFVNVWDELFVEGVAPRSHVGVVDSVGVVVERRFMAESHEDQFRCRTRRAGVGTNRTTVPCCSEVFIVLVVEGSATARPVALRVNNGIAFGGVIRIVTVRQDNVGTNRLDERSASWTSYRDRAIATREPHGDRRAITASLSLVAREVGLHAVLLGWQVVQAHVWPSPNAEIRVEAAATGQSNSVVRLKPVCVLAENVIRTGSDVVIFERIYPCWREEDNDSTIDAPVKKALGDGDLHIVSSVTP